MTYYSDMNPFYKLGMDLALSSAQMNMPGPSHEVGEAAKSKKAKKPTKWTSPWLIEHSPKVRSSSSPSSPSSPNGDGGDFSDFSDFADRGDFSDFAEDAAQDQLTGLAVDQVDELGEYSADDIMRLISRLSPQW